TGRFDEPTRLALEAWLIGAGTAANPVPYHCPVLISSFPTTRPDLPAGLPPDPAAANLWDPSVFISTQTRMFARDGCGYYPGSRRNLDEYQVLGTNLRYETPAVTRVGPGTREQHVWNRQDDTSEYRPETMGFPQGTPSPARLATFEVFRAVAEVE